jgi:hypothetical protein
MWCSRLLPFLLLAILAGSALLLTGAVGQQPPPAPPPANPPSPPPPPPKADPEADQAIGRAIELLDPKKLGWVEMAIWQSVATQGLSFETAGRYLSGPDHLLDMNLKVQVGSTAGQLSIVSDGKTVWNAVRIGSDEPVVTKWELKKVEGVMNSPGTPPQLGEDFFKSQSFAGLVPLLQNLRQELTFTKLEKERWKNHEVLKLAGVWNPDIAKLLAPPPNPWPSTVPRACRVYLDANPPHWLYRLEWWGPVRAGGEDTLLMQTEFRDPKQTAPGDKRPEKYAQAFKFNPGKADVTDKTKELTEQLAFVRDQQAAAQKKRPSMPPTPKKETDSQPKPATPPSKGN